MAVKCPFCGDRIETSGEHPAGTLACPTCHATVDIQLADPMPDAPPLPSLDVETPNEGSGTKAVPTEEPGGFVGSYSLGSKELKHAKETVFNPGDYRPPSAAAARPQAAPEAPPPSAGPAPEFRFRDAAPPPPPPSQVKLSKAYRPEQFLDDKGPEIPPAPGVDWDSTDMNQTLDRLSGFVLDPAAAPQRAAPIVPPTFQAPERQQAAGVRLDDLDLSFDDLQPLKVGETTGAARAAGDPGTTLDIDAVMSEESFAGGLPPWVEPEPAPQRTVPSAESPWASGTSRQPEAGGPAPGARGASRSGVDEDPWAMPDVKPGTGPGPSDFGNHWSEVPLGDGSQGTPSTAEYDFGTGAAGRPEDSFGASLFDGAPSGSLQLDIPAMGGPGTPIAPAAPAGAAPPPATRKGKVEKKVRHKSATGAGRSLTKPLLLAGLLVALVGAILGQTEYGYFGINLLGNGASGPSARRAAAAGNPSGAMPDRRDAWQKEIIRIQRLLVDSPKDEALRSELLMSLSRLRERFPSALAADPSLTAKLQELLGQVRIQGEPGELVKALDLMANQRWAEARAIVDRVRAVASPDAYVPYLAGKIALAQDRLDDAQSAFEAALSKDPSMVAATYFEGRALLKKRDLAKARSTFEAVLAREAEHLSARLGIGEILLASGDVEGAGRMAAEVVAKAQPGADADDLFEARVLMARVEDQRGSREGRLRELRAALGIRPSDAGVAVEVSNLLRADLKTGEALAVLGAAREARRDSEEFLAAYAQAAFADEKPDLAEVAVVEGLQKYPKSPVFHVLRGRHELDQRRLRSAASSFEAALEVDPTSVDAWVMLAQGLSAEGRLGEAAERLKEGLVKTNQSVRLLLALAALQKDQHDMVNAETTLRQAVAKDPADTKAAQDLGLIVAAQGRMEEAAKILGDLDVKRKLDRDGVLGLARALMALHEPGKAREILQRVHESQADDWDIAAELGRAMFEAGQDQEAETVLRKIIQLRPSHHVAYFYLGRLLSKRGDRKGSIDAYENSIRANSRDTLPRIELARIYMDQHDVESVRLAKAQLDVVIGAYTRNEVNVEDRDPDAYLMHGRILFDEQKYNLAMKDFEAALARAPTRTDIMVGFARALFEASRYDDARPYLRQVLGRDPQHPEANYLMGRILVREGKSRLARENLERVVQRDPRSFPEAHRLLGMIYRDEGLNALARSSLETFLRYADPKTGEAEEARQLLARMRR